MDNIQLYYIDNEINKIDKMKQGDVIYKNGVEHRKRLIGNTYQIYRSILHQLAIDENWNNVYSNITLPSGDMGTIKVERVDDDKDNDI